MTARPRRASSRRAASYADPDDEDEYSPGAHASARPTRRAAANRRSYAIQDDEDDDFQDAGEEEDEGGHFGAEVNDWQHEQPAAHEQPYTDPGALRVRLKVGAYNPAAEEEQPQLPAAEEEGEGADQDAPGEADLDAPGEPEYAPTGEYAVQEDVNEPAEASGHGLRPRRRPVIPDSDDEDEEAFVAQQRLVTTTTSSGRQTKRPQFYGESDAEEDVKPQGTRRGLRRGSGYHGDGVEQDEDYTAAHDDDDDYGSGGGGRAGGSGRSRSRRQADKQRSLRRTRDRGSLTQPSRPKARTTRNSRKADQSYEHDEDTEFDTDEEMLDLEDDNDSLAQENEASGRRLRNKPRVNYYVPLQLDAPANGKDKGKGKQCRTDEDGNPFAGLPANMTGAQWAALYPEGGQPSDSSDDDTPNFGSPRKGAVFTGAGAGMTGGMLAGGGLDFGSGAPSNLGKVNNAAALADTDPLGVPTSISFDSVGGLGSHIQQLKEMVSLPLLYPEVFERFNMTPPRGVLFHGPPGTGKTLLARALAASCSTEGRKISFFMRKGADCLSKWVGEAERQLRLLFDEAKACQPSIIFFDEIDGLAPVRSSKQEQIHASIVSTLLALMDGMDGRGQVIVIGATNRPDAIDPALRRPGRFDREFYFPLPNLEARRKIVDIHTDGWNPPLDDDFKDELAKLTKGYGGADLRALCTEAALNAVQRTYPQIYKTNDRLVIKPETISVTARDFIVSQKNLIPSTARSTSSSAAPIPPQLLPLLSTSFDHAKTALAKVLPEVKRVNVLEEAEFVEDGGGFEKEKMMQAFEQLRVFRPRMIICGEPGMGQSYVGAAVLQHLEGFHVQTLDLATLVSDSTRTMEASCVQLFVEAKRHKPSILFIPSLVTWCASVGETVRATIKGLLDGLDPNDPILLLAVVDGHFSEVPPDVRGWFGFVKGNRVVMGKPGVDQRQAFFDEVITALNRPPSEYPDGMPRRKRVLEKLPIAPPPPPREPTAAEIAQLQQNDLRLLEYLKWKLGPVLSELKKRYKRFQRSLYRDWQRDDLDWRKEQLQRQEPVTGLGTQPYHNVDLDTMAADLYKGLYYTPDDFLTDVLRVQANAEVNKIMENDAEAPVRAGQMVNHVKVMLDQTFDAPFRAECDKMAARMRAKDEADPRRRARRKGREGSLPGEEGFVAAAEKAADAGGAHRPRYGTRASGSGDAEGEIEDIGEVEKRLKRAREGAGSGGEGEDGEGAEMDGVEGAEGQGPAKRARFDEQQEGGPAATDLANGQAVALTSGANGVNGHAVPAPAISSGFADLLNPTTSSSLSSFDFTQPIEQPNPFPTITAAQAFAGPVPPPMPVGGTPADGIAPPGTMNGTTPSFLSGLVAPPVAAANPFAVASPAPISPVKKAGSVASAAGTAPSRDGTPTPALNGAAPANANGEAAEGAAAPPAGDAAMKPAEQERSPTPMEATPPPPPPFVVPSDAIDALASFLAQRTDALNIDQLEQLRAACFDAVWRARSEWDRTRVVQELDELAREFVEEVEALAA
ncbi:TAT-binding protein-like protein 7, AAA ATPase [Rhodotorula kratochvilovae]